MRFFLFLFLTKTSWTRQGEFLGSMMSSSNNLETWTEMKSLSCLEYYLDLVAMGRQSSDMCSNRRPGFIFGKNCRVPSCNGCSVPLKLNLTLLRLLRKSRPSITSHKRPSMARNLAVLYVRSYNSIFAKQEPSVLTEDPFTARSIAWSRPVAGLSLQVVCWKFCQCSFL